ncbi:MAG TPA: hypothetical protein IAA11_09650, partial [Candidatus Blautia intestinigallinarum]|nr:hypothetical protein [Candidatus Blautia intestinigallinarum]
LNLALKLLLCLDIVMNPLFRIDFSISDSLKIVRKSVLIYETIIDWADRLRGFVRPVRGQYLLGTHPQRPDRVFDRADFH